MSEVGSKAAGDSLIPVEHDAPRSQKGLRARTARQGTKRGERGMTTAEYAVGTVAAVTFVGVLINVLRDPAVQGLLLDLILWVLRQFWGS